MTTSEARAAASRLEALGLGKNPHRLWMFRMLDRLARGDRVSPAAEAMLRNAMAAAGASE